MPWYGYAFLSAVAIALVGILQKRTLQREHTTEYVTVFSVVKLLLVIILFGGKVDLNLPPLGWALAITTSIIGAAAFFFIAKATKRLEISTVFPLLALDSGLTALLAWVFLGEHLDQRSIIGLAFLVVGTYVLELGNAAPDWFRTASTHPSQLLMPFRTLLKRPGGWFALAGLAFFSISSTLDREVLHIITPLQYVSVVTACQTLIYLMVFVGKRRKLELFQAGRGALVIFIVMAAALHLGSNFVQATAVSLAPVGLVIAIKRTSSFMDVVLGGRIFHEQHLKQKAIASAIMLLGVFFIVT